MTPAARLSAAIEVLDRILAGQAAEPALTNWGRANRFAGSGDRAALRDLVFDALRCKRSFAAWGGAETGRGLILGSLRASGTDPATLFTGKGHAPAIVGMNEVAQPASDLAALDCPDWLAPRLQAALGADFAGVMQALRQRAPVFLRANAVKADADAAIAALAREGITARLNHIAKNALEVTGNARKIQSSIAYAQGLVELQDAASQAVIAALPLQDGMRVLDYCAGGGGKALAMAAQAKLSVDVHDANPGRMRDLPARATRAGVKVNILDKLGKSAAYDLILTDVPCSGSGSWRRDPQGKWALTERRLHQLLQIQAGILDKVAPAVAPDGRLAYVTCSLLAEENAGQVAAFLARSSGWVLENQHSFTPLQGGDGFFLAILKRI